LAEGAIHVAQLRRDRHPVLRVDERSTPKTRRLFGQNIGDRDPQQAGDTVIFTFRNLFRSSLGGKCRRLATLLAAAAHLSAGTSKGAPGDIQRLSSAKFR
jgi:hypothetical protein